MKEQNNAAVIDIGSSSLRLMIAEKNGNDIRIIEYLKNPVQIGRDTFQKGSISQEAINQTLVLIQKYQKILKEYSIADVLVIATTAVREARNRDIFVDTIFQRTGLKIDVLKVGDIVYYIDAYISHRLKDTYPIHEKTLMIAELSSASMDVSILEKGFTVSNHEFPMGTLRLAKLREQLEGTQEEVDVAVKEYIRNEFLQFKSSLPVELDDIILIDEIYSQYLDQILPNKRRSQKFFRISQKDSEQLLLQLRDKTNAEISKAYGVPQENSAAFLTYFEVLHMLNVLTKSKQVHILETSLSEAVLANFLLGFETSKRYDKTNQLISSANYICQKFNVDKAHVRYVADLSKQVFAGVYAQLGLKESDLIYLQMAAYLHDVGSFIQPRSHHKHSEYIIQNLNLSRLTDEEIKMIACISRYHRKAYPESTHLVYNSLDPVSRLLVQKLASILRVANALDRSHLQKIKKLEVVIKGQEVKLVAYSVENLLLEKSDLIDKKELFEEISGSKLVLSVRRWEENHGS